jgi:hypothetical protein
MRLERESERERERERGLAGRLIVGERERVRGGERQSGGG